MDVHPPIGKETLEIGFFVSASRQQCTATASTTPFFPFCHGENIARGPDTTSVHVFFGGNVDSPTDPLSKFRAVYQRGHDQKFISRRVVDGFKISRELLSRTDLINCHCSKSFSRFRDNFCEQTNLRFIIPEIMSVYLSSNSNYF